MKARKASTRTAKRAKLPPRVEWDFSKVTRKDSAVVCMREYAKECLRGVEDGRLIDAVDRLSDSFAETCPGVTADALMLTVCEGFVLRSRAAAQRQSPPTPLLQITATSEETPPPGVQFATFAIDWRATNNELKRAFGEWLKAQQKQHMRQPKTWVKPLQAGLGMVPGADLLDYHDLGVAMVDVLVPDGDDHSKMHGAAVIEAQRLLANQRKGRGDSKRALLTDLGVYRLHQAGCSPVQIQKAMGTGRLKFYDAALVDRAVGNAEEYLARTLLNAFACEAYALANGKRPPETAKT